MRRRPEDMQVQPDADDLLHLRRAWPGKVVRLKSGTRVRVSLIKEKESMLMPCKACVYLGWQAAHEQCPMRHACMAVWREDRKAVNFTTAITRNRGK